jgi:hypothetical protein
MHGAQEYVARLFLFVFQVIFQDLFERFVACGVGLYDVAAIFVDYQ